MKRLLLGTIGLVSLGMVAPAMSADLPAQAYSKAPSMMAALYDWSGFYLGINGGGGSSRKCWDLVSTVAGVIAPGPEGCHNATGGTVGGQAGYRWQAGSWVAGAEVQGNWASFKGSNTNALAPAITDQSRVDGFGLFTGQIGYAWNNVLIYAKGGGAIAVDRFKTYTLPGGVLIDRASDTRWGGTVGAGVEYSFAPNWSVAAEYDHLFMATKDVNAVTPTGAANATDRIRQDVDLATVRVNYRWGGPVISKY